MKTIKDAIKMVRMIKNTTLPEEVGYRELTDLLDVLREIDTTETVNSCCVEMLGIMNSSKLMDTERENINDFKLELECPGCRDVWNYLMGENDKWMKMLGPRDSDDY